MRHCLALVLLSLVLPVAAHAAGEVDSLRTYADSLGTAAQVARARADSAYIASGGGLPPQRDLMDVLSSLRGRDRREPKAVVSPTQGLSFLVLPSIGYNPAFGGYVGAGVSSNGWLGDPIVTNLSVFALNATYSTTGQTSVQVRSDAWLPGNKWRLSGDWRYLDTGQPTYGLGPTNVQVGKYPMKFELFRFYQQDHQWSVRSLPGPV